MTVSSKAMGTRGGLRPYQNRMVKFIHEKKKCNLWVGMGFGKTISTLTAISDLLSIKAVHKTLVIAPLRVCNTVWEQEAAQWTHTNWLRFSNLSGGSKKMLEGIHLPADVYMINRENVEALVMHYKGKWPFDMVVIDESSSFKANSSKRFKALRRILNLTNYVVLLTGTPASNGLLDIWSQCFLVDKGESLGKSMTAYKDTYFTSDYSGYKYVPRGEDAIRKIYEKVTPYTFTLTDEECSSNTMPERIDVNFKVDIPPQALKEYKRMEKDFIVELKSSEVSALSAASLITKLLQMANGAVYDESRVVHEIHDAKLDALAEIMEDVGGENVIVAYNYIHDRERIMKRFTYARVLIGNKPGDTLIEDWNAGEVRMMLVHPRSGGHGLNLQFGGSILVWFGLTHDLELYLQMNARPHRSGQRKVVRIIHLIANGTIDMRVMDVLGAKGTVQSNLIQAVRDSL